MEIKDYLLRFFSQKAEVVNQETYLIKRKIACAAPYPTKLYYALLSMIKKNNRIYVSPFIEDSSPPSNQARFFLRHDIDTTDCIRKMGALLAINRKLGFPSSLFFRADEVEYSLSDYKEEINTYKNQGCEIGLHTVCYTQDDFLKEFRREIMVFRESLGIAPRAFTVHGLGPHFRMEQRMEFCSIMAGDLHEYGFLMSDCSDQLRRYDYVIQDCNMAHNGGNRIIYDDFLCLPPFIQNGKNYLILTHPTYWEKIE